MKKVLLIAILIPILLVGAIYVLAKRGASVPSLPSTAPALADTPLTPGEQVTRVGFGQTITDNDIRITPLSLVSDNRCPKDVTCIQAGTVTIKVELKKEGGGTQIVTLLLGQSVDFGGDQVEFLTVLPDRFSKNQIADQDYRFSFLVSKK